MNSNNPLQTEEPGIGNDSYYAASAVSPNANHQDKTSSLFTIDCVAEPLPNAAQRRIHMLRNQRANNHFLIALHRFGTNIYIFLKGNWNIAAIKLIYQLLWQQFNILRLSFKIKMIFLLTLKAKMMMSICSFRTLQRPPSSQKIVRALPHCPIIHWASQMCNDTRLCFCPCSKHSSPWRDNNSIFIHRDHGCMVGLMTPQELLQHLRNEGDSTHTAISIYLETLNTFI